MPSTAYWGMEIPHPIGPPSSPLTSTSLPAPRTMPPPPRRRGMGDRRSSAATRRSCCFPHAAGNAQTTRSPNIVPNVRRIGVLRAVQVAPKLLVGGPNNPEPPAAVQRDVGPRPDDGRSRNEVTTDRAHRRLAGVRGEVRGRLSRRGMG